MIVDNTGWTLKRVGDYSPFAYCAVTNHLISNASYILAYGELPNLWWYQPVNVGEQWTNLQDGTE